MLTQKDLLANKNVLGKWLRDLIDVTRRNKLINLTKSSSVEFFLPEDAANAFISLTVNRKVQAFAATKNIVNGKVTMPATYSKNNVYADYNNLLELKTALEKIAKTNRAFVNDKGIWTSYMSFGSLKWEDSKGQQCESPLVLVPVNIKTNNSSIHIEINDDENIRLNHALILSLYNNHKLKLSYPDEEEIQFIEDDMQETLFDVDDFVETDSTSNVNYLKIIESIKKQIEEIKTLDDKFRSWELTNEILVTNFTTHSEIIYRDLERHANVILENSTIQDLCKAYIGADGSVLENLPMQTDEQLNSPSEILNISRVYENIGEAESPPLLFNADDSQAKAISACLLNPNTNFLIQGPPGTGKSQTIANLIAGYMYEGKSVLFVSEKAAAIQVVKDKLDDKNLEDFIINLHSPIKRATFAHHVGATVNQINNKSYKKLAVEIEGLKENKEKLNKVRSKLSAKNEYTGETVYEMIGEVENSFYDYLIRARNADELKLQKWDLPPAERVQFKKKLSKDNVNDIKANIKRIAEVWADVNQDENFHWHGILNPTDDLIGSEANKALKEMHILEELLNDNSEIVGHFSVESLGEIKDLIKLNYIYSERVKNGLHSIPVEWMDKEYLEKVESLKTTVEEFNESFTDLINELDKYSSFNIDCLDGFDNIKEFKNTVQSKPELTIAEFKNIVDKKRTVFDALSRIYEALPDEEKNITFGQLSVIFEMFRLGAQNSMFKPSYIMVNESFEYAIEAYEILVNLFGVISEAKAKAESFYDLEKVDASIDRFTEAVNVAELRNGKKPMLSNRQDKPLWNMLDGAVRKDNNLKPKEVIPENWHKLKIYLDAKKGLNDFIENKFKNYGLTVSEILEIQGLIINEDIVEKIKVKLDNANSIRKIISSNANVLITYKTLQDSLYANINLPPTWSKLFDDLNTLDEQKYSDSTIVSFAYDKAEAEDSWDSIVVNMLNDISNNNSSTSLAEILKSVELYEHKKKIESEYKDIRIQWNKMTGNNESLQLPESAYSDDFKDAILKVQKITKWLYDYNEVSLSRHGMTNSIDNLMLSDSNSKDHIESTYNKLIVIIEKDILSKFENEYKGILSDKIYSRSLQDSIKILDTFKMSTSRSKWEQYKVASKVLTDFGFKKVFQGAKEKNILFGDSTDDDKAVRLYVEAWLLVCFYTAIISEELNELHNEGININGSDLKSLQPDYKGFDEKIRAKENSRLIAKLFEYRDNIKASQSEVLKDTIDYVRKQGNAKRNHDPVSFQIARGKNYTLKAIPCFMMSPKTVSEFLPSDVQFDVVIYDEASQITVPNAINSIYRGKQIVIVGDDLQMPPTRFFASKVIEYDEDDAEAVKDDFESIIKVGNSLREFNKDYALRVHYRSKHESLIWFSNEYIYKPKAGISLEIPPSSRAVSDDYGVKWVSSPKNSYVPSGVAKNKRTACNPTEAKLVAQMIVEHYANHSDKSLGVIALSKSQQETIEDELNNLRLNNSGANLLMANLDEDRLHGLFIKNLENVQGDERDFIILSVGYGHDSNGLLNQRFGPMSNEGGFRRLNVAITRAKEKLYVVSSIEGKDITSSSNENSKLFADFLNYAKNGMQSSKENLLAGDDSLADSPFELEVGQVIRSWGYTISRQVGVGSFKIDVGVKAEGTDGASHIFGLGIECDGAAYHSSDEDRTRDIVRQEILENHGWNIHRVWSTDWFNNRKEEEKRLRDALELYCGTPRGIKTEINVPYSTVQKEYLNQGIML